MVPRLTFVFLQFDIAIDCRHHHWQSLLPTPWEGPAPPGHSPTIALLPGKEARKAYLH